MTVAIHPGWWLIPATITFLSFISANWATPTSKGGYGDIAGLVTFGAAAIVSLIAWLVWALVA